MFSYFAKWVVFHIYLETPWVSIKDPYPAAERLLCSVRQPICYEAVNLSKLE